MTRKLTTLLGILSVALAVLAGAAIAAEPSYSPQAERALGERYEAIAAYYLGTPTSMPGVAVKALGERYEAMADYYAQGTSMSPAAVRALGERYEAMAEYYREAELAQAKADASEFEWLDATIGGLVAVGAIAAVLVLAFSAYRHTHHPPASPAAL
jgi:hypothetical protein